LSEAKDVKEQIGANVLDARRRIRDAARRAGRRPEDVVLLAASKNRSVDEILVAAEAGVTVFGENRVQEMLSKMPEARGLDWHFIGHLQSKKARQVVGLVSLIHSVDSVKLASEISARARAAGSRQRVLFQVSLAGEESKTGFLPGELEEALKEAAVLVGLEVVGLSTIAPLVEEPEEVRWVFRELKGLAGRLAGGTGRGLVELSMGMTNDFEVAVEEGSTIVRIGTALFGARA
jgi:pyridoxal phosphate enzyme (YggS family)